jgi:alkaline phosphatase
MYDGVLRLSPIIASSFQEKDKAISTIWSAVSYPHTSEANPAATGHSYHFWRVGSEPAGASDFVGFSSASTVRGALSIDGLIIVFVFLAYWAKVLDSSATGTAYVSGMKEDLKVKGICIVIKPTLYQVSFDPQSPPWAPSSSHRIDIIVFVFLAYWAKVLDSSATGTAYVSGMKEDLKLYGFLACGLRAGWSL